MVLALMNRFDPRILDVINDYVHKQPVIDWKRVWGYTFICKIRHCLTNGYPRGGYVYFHREKSRLVQMVHVLLRWASVHLADAEWYGV